MKQVNTYSFVPHLTNTIKEDGYIRLRKKPECILVIFPMLRAGMDFKALYNWQKMCQTAKFKDLNKRDLASTWLYKQAHSAIFSPNSSERPVFITEFDKYPIQYTGMVPSQEMLVNADPDFVFLMSIHCDSINSGAERVCKMIVTGEQVFGVFDTKEYKFYLLMSDYECQMFAWLDVDNMDKKYRRGRRDARRGEMSERAIEYMMARGIIPVSSVDSVHHTENAQFINVPEPRTYDKYYGQECILKYDEPQLTYGMRSAGTAEKTMSLKIIDYFFAGLNCFLVCSGDHNIHKLPNVEGLLKIPCYNDVSYVIAINVGTPAMNLIVNKDQIANMYPAINNPISARTTNALCLYGRRVLAMTVAGIILAESDTGAGSIKIGKIILPDEYYTLFDWKTKMCDKFYTLRTPNKVWEGVKA